MPQRRRERRFRSPPWHGPPRGTVPGVVPVELVIARNEKVAVFVARVAAYPTGFEIELQAISRDEDDDLDPMLFMQGHFRRTRRGDEIPTEILRFGVQFADGSKATNTDGGRFDPSGPPNGPVMQEQGGGGGSGSWEQSYWIWPLPPSGPLTFVCEWPAADIPLTRLELDAQAILDTSGRAQVIFSEEHLPDPPSSGGTVISI